jgi:hypothetical protein
MISRPQSNNLLLAFLAVLFFFAGVMQLCLEPASRQSGEARLEEEEERENRPDRPDEAVRFRRLQLQDERGYIPPDGLEKARRHVKLMKQAQQQRIKKRIAPLAAGIEPDSWEWLGPGNIGGRIRAIVISPTNANNMWVGSVSGGIWRTTNAGASWQPVNDFLANLAVSTIVINPTNSNIMYAGTGEGFANIDSLRGAGVFRSTDGGLNWNQLASTANNNWFFVNRLAISPNGNTILAANSPLLDGNGNVIQNGGIWQSTDGGTTWTQRTTAQTFDIDFHPTDNTRAIAGVEGGTQFSTDGGQTWTAATFNPVINPQPPPPTFNRRIELAYAPSAPATVYATVNQAQTGSASGTYRGETYQSTNGGQTFNRVNFTTDFFGGQGWYDNIVWVNPQDPTFVVVGGIDLWRSTDSGTSFTKISTWQDAPLSAHADNHMLVAHPGFNNSTNRIVYIGNDGGIYRADDIAGVPVEGIPNYTGWVELNNSLGITQFYGAAGNAGSGVIIGGAQDNGTVRYTGGTESWTMPRAGDGGYCAADPTDASYFYGEYIRLEIYRSGNAGQNFTDIFAGITDAGRNISPPRANFIAPFILDPNDPNTMLAGGQSLWRTNNVKASGPPDFVPFWGAIKAPTTGNSPISAITVAPGNSNFILVGHNNGDIYRTFTGTSNPPNWGTKIDPPAPALPDRPVTRLVIDNTRSPNWIYSTFGGFSPDNVYRSTDLGSTWTDITGTGVTGLPSVPVRALAIHPRNANLLYVGTEIGIFVSEDAGANWEPTTDGPANVSVDELFWMGADLIAATHGRGLYRASGGVYVDCNYNGIEIGTFNQPFRTVTSAITATTRYRAIWIKPCNYNETITTSKRLELRALGGPVIIGRP